MEKYREPRAGWPVWAFDLDDTLANTAPRAHLNPRLTDNGPGWIPYSMACDTDLPIEPMIALARAGRTAGKLIFIVTGRTEHARTLTEDWLHRYGVPYDVLYMRPKGDTSSNAELKLARLARIQDVLGAKVELWVDDYPKVIDAMQREGLATLLYCGSDPHHADPFVEGPSVVAAGASDF